LVSKKKRMEIRSRVGQTTTGSPPDACEQPAIHVAVMMASEDRQRHVEASAGLPRPRPPELVSHQALGRPTAVTRSMAPRPPSSSGSPASSPGERVQFRIRNPRRLESPPRFVDQCRRTGGRVDRKAFPHGTLVYGSFGRSLCLFRRVRSNNRNRPIGAINKSGPPRPAHHDDGNPRIAQQPVFPVQLCPPRRQAITGRRPGVIYLAEFTPQKSLACAKSRANLAPAPLRPFACVLITWVDRTDGAQSSRISSLTRCQRWPECPPPPGQPKIFRTYSALNCSAPIACPENVRVGLVVLAAQLV